jgi:hypothetical protein
LKPLAIWILACFYVALAYGALKGKICKRDCSKGTGDDDENNDYDEDNVL